MVLRLRFGDVLEIHTEACARMHTCTCLRTHVYSFPEKGPLIFIRSSKCFMIPQKLRLVLVCCVLAGTECGLENTNLGPEPASKATRAGLSSPSFQRFLWQ